MDKLGDIDLFVRVIKNQGLAAAGREVGLSPARMTARINGLEERYGVRLLNRTTRQVSLTDEGRKFYISCERILAEVEQAETSLQTGQTSFTGALHITAPSDLGQQHIAPVLSTFVEEHPGITPYLYLSDSVVDLVGNGFDLGIRYGNLKDSTLIARRLASNRRVLCASPDYLKRKGTPRLPEELTDHDCLTMVRMTEPLTTWYFQRTGENSSVSIKGARASNDGALIRRWTVEGAGIALKSYWDIADDLKAKRLVTIMDNYQYDFSRTGTSGGADLHVLYPNRKFISQRTTAFIDALKDYFYSVNSE
ncbi:LysR family transcriptional regulator [Colwellia sp. 75C3]|uniref:LysR family transcriptional regulator n=1 Tax=Colwellia sp. 75C3 TaxID=888425 RepID=UPI000C33F99F|nr:LysR family transcriptional regulator [Colwellia sp. 75C3]PKG82141.1 LysR family transcriptional regulator [Colwellia sp. 75C3]